MKKRMMATYSFVPVDISSRLTFPVAFVVYAYFFIIIYILRGEDTPAT